jgi:5S rRNA maturation endonuclease (ribonuclease M5)
MELRLDGTFREIARAIVVEGKTDDAERSEIESDDMFQSRPYVGGRRD